MRHRLLLPMLLASTMVAVAACDDDLTDPESVTASAEAEAIMRSAAALPLLPQYFDVAGNTASERARLQRARELWDAGMVSDDARADAQRRLAVRHALPALLQGVPDDEWLASRQRLDEWMVTASAMLRHLDLPLVETRLRTAERHLSRSDAATGDRDRAYHLLLAGSELVATTPRFVARSMAQEAERAVRSAAASDDPPPAKIMKRAERLKDWSSRAVEDGEYLLAIQRGYYAIQLVEER